MELTLYTAAAIFFAGLLVGFINTLSGSGSLITLPLLIFFGMDAGVANGSNRIAILLQTLVGLLTFRKQKILEPIPAFKLAIPVVLGAVPGAIIATLIPDVYFEKVLGGIFIVMTFVIILVPGKWNKTYVPGTINKITLIHYFLFFLIGMYGGFIQAGVGIFMLFALVMGPGFDLIRANALKLFLTFIFTPLAIVIFWQSNQIDWAVGLVLAAGNMIGAYVAAKTAIKSGTKFIKWLIISMILFSAIQFIFFR
jgi:uncharacterized protein